MDLPDSQLSASSYYDQTVAADDSRLNALKAWSPSVTTNQYIQADLGELKQITAVATQGRTNYHQHNYQFVTSYTISHSIDGSTYDVIQSTFDANSDRDSIVENSIVPAVNARYVRLHPQTWQDHPSMRWEIYGCDHTTSGMAYS